MNKKLGAILVATPTLLILGLLARGMWDDFGWYSPLVVAGSLLASFVATVSLAVGMAILMDDI